MIFTWGSTYYLMTVLAAPIPADTGWRHGAITGALSAGLLIAGLASPRVGQAIARHGDRPVLAAGGDRWGPYCDRGGTRALDLLGGLADP